MSTQPTTSERPLRKNVRKRRQIPWYARLLLTLFLVHTAVTIIAAGTGPLAYVRSFLLKVFWVPENWIGQPLPPHQQLVYTTVTFLQSLPFWDLLWWLCGLPALGILAVLLLLPKLRRFLRRRGSKYTAQKAPYRNAKTGWLLPPSPGLRRRVTMANRLRALRKRSLPQTEQLCRRADQACLVEVLSYSGIDTPFHLCQDLAVRPHWSVGRQLAPLLSPSCAFLSLSRDKFGGLGFFQHHDLLFPLSPGTFFLWETDLGRLTLQQSPPASSLEPVLEIHVYQTEKEVS